MREYHYLLALPGPDVLSAIAGHLRKRGLSCHDASPRQVTRIYLDSHDWRLFHQGFELIVEMRDKRRCLRLRQRRSGLSLVQVEASQLPDFASSLPSGVRWQAARRELGRRRLSPVLRLLVDEQALRVDDALGKQVARLSVERYDLISAEAAGQELSGPQLCLTPVRGYDEALRQIRRCLEKKMGWHQYGGDCLLEALAILGRYPQRSLTPEKLKLRADEGLGRSLQRLLAVYLDQIETNEKGVEADLDEEFLHDFRIALRRCRSLLSSFREVLTGTEFQRLRDELAWLSAESAPLRDYDVQNTAVAEYVAAESGGRSRRAEPLLAWLRQQRQAVRQGMLAALRSARYQDMKQQWRRLAGMAGQPWLASSKASGPVVDAVDAMLCQRFERLQKRLDLPILLDSRSRRRELRKEARRLRYLLDAFESLLPERCLRKEGERLRRLEEFLGEGQDLFRRQQMLEGYQRHLLHEAEERPLPPETVLLLARLLRRARQQQRDWLASLSVELKPWFGKAAQRRFRKHCLHDRGAR